MRHWRQPVQLEIPDNMPRRGNFVTRAIGRTILRFIGWRVTGELPNIKKLVICGAPHTSNWDFISAMGVSLAIGIRFSYLMKKEAFFWPFKGLFMRLGGIPIDRKAAEDTVEQISSWYHQHNSVWLAITPEGTRKKVEKWKTGFLRIAHAADVPVLIVCWHYPEKTMVIDRLWEPSGDHVKDAEDIRAYINQHYQGANPKYQ